MKTYAAGKNGMTSCLPTIHELAPVVFITAFPGTNLIDSNDLRLTRHPVTIHVPESPVLARAICRMKDLLLSRLVYFLTGKLDEDGCAWLWNIRVAQSSQSRPVPRRSS